MNAILRQAFTEIAIGTQMEGGYFAGAYVIDDKPHGLIVAPKAQGDLKPQAWNSSSKMVADATSFVDGRKNTIAMAEAGSKLAKAILALDIGGFTDWYLSAQDELEIAYRAFKPNANRDSLWSRSGINLSALPPTYPYSVAPVSQTAIDLFRAGGPEAFEAGAYWTSTQHAENSDDAWGQNFTNGNQDYWTKDIKLRARVFRRFPI